MSLEDTKAFGNVDLRHRLDRGGLPPFFLAKEFPEKGYQEWTESFWAKDIEELFNVDKKHAFLKFFELLALQSGGLFEAQSFAAPCGVSHTTIATYLQVMAQTHVASILRPFHKNQAKEIIAAAKVYFFDTGFINYFKGQTTSNAQDLGFHWENLVLNQLLTFLNRDEIHYWRDKSKNEVDFVVKRRGEKPLAIECKWSAKEFDAKAITKFREIHPGGKNLVVTQDTLHRREKAIGPEKYLFCPLTSLSDVIKPKLK
jgi:predicted AAA+ superfamily ATPase